jgi:hypothetical protein
LPPFGIELKHALGNGPMTVADLQTLFMHMGLATLLAACVSYRVWRPLMPFTSPPSPQGAQTQTLVKNTRVVEMSNRVADLGKDSGKLVVELDLRGNMDAATIREVLEANQVPGVYRVALAE